MRVIINADDFGLCNSVNKAIIDVFTAGNLSSTTIMVNMPGTTDAMALAKQHPELGIGLHFCLTEGRSLADHDTLTDENGSFYSRSELINKMVKGKIDHREIRTELESQLDVLDSSGTPYFHVDSHQHVMMWPELFLAIEPILKERNLHARVVRPSAPPLSLALSKPSKFIKSRMNIRFANKIKARTNIKTNDYLVSIHDLKDPNNINSNTYLELLASIPEDRIAEVMVHPYILGEELRDMYSNTIGSKEPFLRKCENEYSVLSGSPIFTGYDLITYQALDQE